MKFIVSLLVAVIVCSLSCSAADLDSVDYYSLSPVQSLSPTVNSALDYAVMPLADTTSGWSSDDSDNLYQIYRALIFNVSAYPGSIVQSLRDIASNTSRVSDIYLSVSSAALSLEEINDAIQNDYDSLKSLLTAIWDDTESLNSYLQLSRGPSIGYFDSSGSFVKSYDLTAVPAYWVSLIGASLTGDFAVGNYNDYSLFHYVKRLSQVLASDDDLALANSQKANREEIESEFLTGSSGSTSLGVSDFGDLAVVGGTIKDSLSLDGNATIGSFTSGLTAADSAGQGWFSEETRSQLDAVSSTITFSLRDPDPYNMSGWEDRYYWLLGDDE